MAVRYLAQHSSSRASEHSLRTLERRLDDGYRRIDQGIADGVDVANWEEFWIDLLRQYEVLSDEIAAADAAGPENWDLAA